MLSEAELQLEKYLDDLIAQRGQGDMEDIEFVERIKNLKENNND